MTAIEAASVRVSTLADGTLRLVVDIEPRHANAAFTLFGSPGVAMALAALKPAAPDKPEKRERMGPLCEWAVKACGDALFQSWAGVVDEKAARSWVLQTCGIESRKELDVNDAAAEVLHAHIRGPFMQWQRSKR